MVVVTLLTSDSGSFDISAGETLDYSVDCVVPDGAAYMYVYLFTNEISTDGISYLGFDCNFLSVTTALSSIENNSQMMDAVIDGLDELSSKQDATNEELAEISALLQQILDQMSSDSSGGDHAEIERLLASLDARLETHTSWLEQIWNALSSLSGNQGETNDKLDDILSGGEAGDELVEGSDKLDQSGEQLGGVVDDLHGAQDALPDLPDNIADVLVDNTALVVDSNVNGFMPWNDSDYGEFWNLLFTPTVAAVSVALLLYFVFGKARSTA